jgi:glycosyltransferase involved in cell wall biosynthesis
MKVAVVTPTIGSKYLKQCLESVQKQTYSDLTHYIFLDGEEYFANAMIQGINKAKKHPIKSIGLQENVGKGWYGHRVYAACSFLVNADVICYLDEDNWYEEDHVAKLVEKINNGNDWAYSLRKIHDKDGNFVCNDNCESLGKWPVYFNDKVFHIDTSSFAVRTNVAVKVGHSWYGKWGADRQFFGTLKQYFTKFDCTNSYTSCYRLDGNAGSVTKDFFEKGNNLMHERYGDDYPWLKQRSFVYGPRITIIE